MTEYVVHYRTNTGAIDHLVFDAKSHAAAAISALLLAENIVAVNAGPITDFDQPGPEPEVIDLTTTNNL